jgi:hypothetical protein
MLNTRNDFPQTGIMHLKVANEISRQLPFPGRQVVIHRLGVQLDRIVIVLGGSNQYVVRPLAGQTTSSSGPDKNRCQHIATRSGRAHPPSFVSASSGSCRISWSRWTGWIRVSTPTEISTAPTTGMSFHAHASGMPNIAKYGTQAALVMRPKAP